MANLAEKQKLIFLCSANCPCCTFSLPVGFFSSSSAFFVSSQQYFGEQGNKLRYVQQKLHYNQHLSITPDVQHHRPREQKLFLMRKLCSFSSLSTQFRPNIRIETLSDEANRYIPFSLSPFFFSYGINTCTSGCILIIEELRKRRSIFS